MSAFHPFLTFEALHERATIYDWRQDLDWHCARQDAPDGRGQARLSPDTAQARIFVVLFGELMKPREALRGNW